MGGMLAWVAFLRGWHANVSGVGGVLVRVACLRGWCSCAGVVLTCVAGGVALT